MHQSDASSSNYQYYQSHFQNPNPSANPANPQMISSPASFASAPPVSSTVSPTDQSAYSSATFPAYPQYADQGSVAPTASSQLSNPSSHPYSLPHLMSQPTPYHPYDQSHGALNYSQPNSWYDSNSNPSYSSTLYSPASDYGNASQSGSNHGTYGQQGMYGGGPGELRPEVDSRYDYGGFPDSGTESGVYRYSGAKTEPYGARGTGPKSSSGVLFDDYGRPIGFADGKQQNVLPQSNKVVRAAPKAEVQQEMGSGVLKFRVRLLSEGAGQSDMDVLCQIGLDGIRLLDLANYRTLKIYPLETVTRWEVLDSFIFAFWAKSSIDAEARRIRLKSNSYTTNNILDAVTAASIQFKEIGSSYKSSDTPKSADQPYEKKKGFVDWMNIIKPKMEEKDHWVPDEAVAKCTACGADFGPFVRRHHCRNCGDIFCDKCTQGRISLTADGDVQPVRVCDRCMAEVTQRLANAKERAVSIAPLQSHEDLARKLKEEMEKNRRTSTGFKSEGSGKQMKDVACPTCTVHLQVRVPASGSETIECSVCQHPFLVNSY